MDEHSKNKREDESRDFFDQIEKYLQDFRRCAMGTT